MHTSYGERVAANLQRTLSRYSIKASTVAKILGIEEKAVHHRNNGDAEYGIDDAGRIIEFIGLDFSAWMEKALDSDIVLSETGPATALPYPPTRKRPSRTGKIITTHEKKGQQ